MKEIIFILACVGIAFISYFIGKVIGYLLKKLWNKFKKEKLEVNE